MALPKVYPAPGTNVFPGARSIVVPPISSDWHKPPAWGKNGTLFPGPGIFTAAGANFITNGVQPDDVLFICDNDQHTKCLYDIQIVASESDLFLYDLVPDQLTNCWFKAGQGPEHTWKSLVEQMAACGPYSAQFRWGKLWSDAEPEYYLIHQDGLLINIVQPIP